MKATLAGDSSSLAFGSIDDLESLPVEDKLRSALNIFLIKHSFLCVN
jgi:hypothetical protein